MSTGFSLDTPSDFSVPLPESAVGIGARYDAGELGATAPPTAFDAELLQETKIQIRAIVNEIARLAQSDVPLEQFYDEFLSRVVAALAAVGGALWIRDGEGRIQLGYQINLTETGVFDRDEGRAQHTLLIRKVFHDGRPVLVPPRSGSFDPDEPGNPTDLLLVIGTLPLEDQLHAVVEIFQRPAGGPAAQRGYLRFVGQMCELAVDYLKNHRLRLYSDRQALWERLEGFSLAIHRRLDVRATAYAIVNDGRLLIDCDRLTLALRRGARWQVEAVSGLDSIDRRSRELAGLTQLVGTAMKTGEPIWLSPAADDLPPQLETLAQEYIDHAHSKLVGILPLYQADPGSATEADAAEDGAFITPDLIGALVVEQFHDSQPSQSLAVRSGIVVQHAGGALANALAHEGVFLMPVWRALGKTRLAKRARSVRRGAWAALLVGVVAAAGWLIPADLNVPAAGRLQPSMRRDVFALVDGVVVDVPVSHGQQVKQGQVLAQLRNTHVEVEVSRLIGKQVLLDRQIRSQEQELLRNKQSSDAQRDRLAVEISHLKQEAANVANELATYQERQRHLTVVADQPGEVVTWQVGTSLIRRPVREGEVLMTIVDPHGPWELELDVAERQMGHVLAALREQSGAGLGVRFVLSTHPDREFQGRVAEVHRQAETADGQGGRVRIRVATDKHQLPELHPGATVAAKVHCGRCSLAYSWLHDVIDAVHGKLLFWLS